jgi:hypothetical protein
MFKSVAKFLRKLFYPLKVVGEVIGASKGMDHNIYEPFIVPETDIKQDDKKNLTQQDETIIGIREPALIRPMYTPLTVVKFDTSTYPDRAIVQLKNNTSSNWVLTGLSIHGKLVVKSAGQNGYLWEYSDYDSIEKNGERFFEISNDFMTSPEQVEAVGDFCWKTLKPHAMYQLSLVGCQHQFSIGDFYELKIDYRLPGAASEIESIDIAAEIMNVSFTRNVGDIGETQLTVRQAIGTWNKTTPRRARLIGAGMPQYLLNRGNQLLVASSTYTGQADYYCDGVDDNVEIQAAIDAIADQGGGLILFTSGSYNILESINITSNIKLLGDGNTIITGLNGLAGSVLTGGVSGSPVSGIVIRDIVFKTTVSSFINIYFCDFEYSNTIRIGNCIFHCADVTKGVRMGRSGLTGDNQIVNCAFYDIAVMGIEAGGENCLVSSCTIQGGSGSGVTGVLIGNSAVVEKLLVRDLAINHPNPASGIVCASNTVVSGCVIASITNAGAGFGFGLLIQGSNASVSGNNITGCKTGVYVASFSNRNVLTGNRSTANTTNFTDAGTNTTDSGNDWT